MCYIISVTNIHIANFSIWSLSKEQICNWQGNERQAVGEVEVTPSGAMDLPP